MAEAKAKDATTIECPQIMGPEQFRAWRKSLGLKQKEAAERLGLKKRMIQYYEKGNRDGRPVEIPKSIRLACYALSLEIIDFDGSDAQRVPEKKSKILPLVQVPAVVDATD